MSAVYNDQKDLTTDNAALGKILCKYPPILSSNREEHIPSHANWGIISNPISPSECLGILTEESYECT